MYRLFPSLLLKRMTFQRFSLESSCRVPNDQAKTEVCYVTIEASELSVIRRMCKTMGVTLNSVLETSGQIALSEMIIKKAKEKGHTTTELSSCEDHIAVNPCFRNSLPKDSPDRDNYVACHAYQFRRSINVSEWANEERFWAFAKQVQTQNHAKLQESRTASQIWIKLWSLSRENPSLYRHHFDHLNKSRMTQGFTNHGDCNFLNRDISSGIAVRGLLAGVPMVNLALAYHYITTINNKLIWNVLYPTHLTNHQDMSHYLNRCLTILKKHTCVHNN